MKAAVYVVEQGGGWQARISLNLAVDESWWAGEAEGLVGWEGRWVDGENEAAERKGRLADRKFQQEYRVVLLSRSLPLGWAVKLAAACKFTAPMQRWKETDWGRYAAALLKAEIKAEQAAGGSRGEGGLLRRLRCTGCRRIGDGAGMGWRVPGGTNRRMDRGM